MSNILDSIKFGFLAIGALLGGFLGGMDGLIYVLLGAMVLDYITGLCVAGFNKQISSEIGFKGIAKKVVILCLVGFANMLDCSVIGTGTMIRTAVIMFYLANEGISLTENAGNLGLPLPKKLVTMLKQLKSESEGEINE